MEGCQSFLEELVGYRVYYWEHRACKFKEKEIGMDKYDPLLHRYFSYQLWKERVKEIKAKQRAKRKHLKGLHDLQEGQPENKKTCRENPSWNSSPPSYSAASPIKL